MTRVAKPLDDLTAGELMSRDLVIIPHEMSLQRAAKLLAGADVTGAPVVDVEGRCIGMLSSTDFVRWANRDEEFSRANAGCGCVHASWQMVDIEELPTDRVADCMTADAVTVTPQTGLRELARKMVDAHIHRVVVVDPRNHPIGIVSTTDILAAVAEASPSTVGATQKPAGAYAYTH